MFMNNEFNVYDILDFYLPYIVMVTERLYYTGYSSTAHSISRHYTVSNLDKRDLYL